MSLTFNDVFNGASSRASLSVQPNGGADSTLEVTLHGHAGGFNMRTGVVTFPSFLTDAMEVDLWGVGQPIPVQLLYRTNLDLSRGGVYPEAHRGFVNPGMDVPLVPIQGELDVDSDAFEMFFGGQWEDSPQGLARLVLLD